MIHTVILIMAAGSASRMGKTKQLLPYKNTTLLEHAIEQAQKSVVKNVYCVLGANKETIQEKIKHHPIEIIYNPNYKNGLSTSIAKGIEYIQEKNFDTVLIMLADQPHVTFEYLNSLIEISEKNPLKIIASKYQHTVGVPAIFPKKYFHNLMNLKGDKGAKSFLESPTAEIIKTTISNNLVDIDTPEDYKNLLENPRLY
ncbi:nucleotidyltransferase family protein [Tenacibaculum tangerinum]|uniref:Nucleotidyltransferase family protein n=1 Tax=Tenacibaculum tangerinum TaxID=3038772 RepID=A0ABY8KZ24_9FLAO|nr:nucleotidyltransferase family protein [Tenacibaculum tangerinum]WGH74256.1 nucleotidyltransferase family protein [Tenacibaculum tangerinum]